LIFISGNFRRSYLPIRPRSRSRARPLKARWPSRRKTSLPGAVVPDPTNPQDSSTLPKE
jgi:hypothetical protein